MGSCGVLMATGGRQLQGDRLFTRSSSRGLYTRNLNETIKLEQFVLNIDRAKKTTEQEFLYQQKIYKKRHKQMMQSKFSAPIVLHHTAPAWSKKDVRRLVRDIPMVTTDPYQDICAVNDDGASSCYSDLGSQPGMSRHGSRRASRDTGTGRRRTSRSLDHYVELQALIPEVSCDHEDTSLGMSSRGSVISDILDEASSFCDGMGSRRVSLVPPEGFRRSRRSSSIISVNDPRVGADRLGLARRRSVLSKTKSEKPIITITSPKHASAADRRMPSPQIDVGDLERLTRRLSIKSDHDESVSNPDLMTDEERQIYNFLQQTPGVVQEKGGRRNSIRVYSESPQRRLERIFGGVISDDENDDRTFTSRTGGAMLERLVMMPVVMPPVYLTRTRSSLMGLRKGPENQVQDKDLQEQWENLRYCRYLRIPDHIRNRDDQVDPLSRRSSLGGCGDTNSGTDSSTDRVTSLSEESN